MIKIIKNPKLSKEEIKVLERKLEKIKEDINYYYKEYQILKSKKTYSANFFKTENKLKKLYADMNNILELLE